MKKLIDLPEDTKKKLQEMADKEGRKLKNFIEQVLIKLADSNKKK